MSPLLAAICATWIDVWKGTSYLSVISIGGSMDDSDQACKFFKWLDKNTCPRGRATTPLVHERFTRYKAEAVAARNKRDEAHAREAKARELLRIAKRKAEKLSLHSRLLKTRSTSIG
ncbi:hypothetical protein SO802_012555 [Lithocarpus litseifolius]|uniref:Uncharacterized protein n=1 Tax=Lithocarpus litseifolius TaxID=425828 RepID=A0AAW2D3W6_9ROSI